MHCIVILEVNIELKVWFEIFQLFTVGDLEDLLHMVWSVVLPHSSCIMGRIHIMHATKFVLSNLPYVPLSKAMYHILFSQIIFLHKIPYIDSLWTLPSEWIAMKVKSGFARGVDCGFYLGGRGREARERILRRNHRSLLEPPVFLTAFAFCRLVKTFPFTKAFKLIK